MGERVTTKLHRWHIVRLKTAATASTVEDIGMIDAPDAKSAIQEAIKQYDIKEPWQQQKLGAYRVS